MSETKYATTPHDTNTAAKRTTGGVAQEVSRKGVKRISYVKGIPEDPLRTPKNAATVATGEY